MWKVKIIVLLTAAVLVVWTTGCTTKKATGADEIKKQQELYILAAASMTDACTALKDSFEKKYPEIALTISFDSSGTLKTQIEEGAPADIFISAAMKQMNELDQAGLMDSASIHRLLENKVVLIKPADSDLNLVSFEDVGTDKVSMVAIGGADVPVGQYSEAIFRSLGLWESVSTKANLGTNVRQVLDWVATGNVDCGIVYETDAQIEENVTIVCEAPEGSCEPVIYPAGIVKTSEHQKEAAKFMTYLKTEEAQDIFRRYGFTVLPHSG